MASQKVILTLSTPFKDSFGVKVEKSNFGMNGSMTISIPEGKGMGDFSTRQNVAYQLQSHGIKLTNDQIRNLGQTFNWKYL